MIELSNVTKLYKKVIGVNDVDLRIDGGAYGLLGPNGSGKTTLINLLTGQLRPTLGRVRVLDADPWRDRSVLRRIGLCPATDVLYPNVSASQWVRYLVRMHGFDLPEANRLADESLRRVGLADAMHRPMGTYSLGMRQRAKIAQAIAHKPDLLILDEPYNGLDPVGRYHTTEMLKQWAVDGKSMLFASHVLHEVEAITSSFLLIRNGRLLASGTAAEVQAIVDRQPQEVTLLGTGLAGLARRAAQADWVDGLHLTDAQTRLRIGLRDPAPLYRHLAQWIAEDRVNVTRLESPDGNLNALFDVLIRRHRGES